MSDPPGAEVYRESELIGNAPTEIAFVKNNKEVTVTAQLPGYDDAKIVINPLERKDGQELRLKLKKPVKGPPKTTKIKPTGPGTDMAPVMATMRMCPVSTTCWPRCAPGIRRC